MTGKRDETQGHEQIAETSGDAPVLSKSEQLKPPSAALGSLKCSRKQAAGVQDCKLFAAMARDAGDDWLKAIGLVAFELLNVGRGYGNSFAQRVGCQRELFVAAQSDHQR
jgi:hypothetical protein